jgi:serralysin
MLGLLGDDTLDGSSNRDTIDGGGGNGLDTYAVENIGDRIMETGTIDSQSDQVQSFINYTLGNGLESLWLKGAEDVRAPI